MFHQLLYEEDLKAKDIKHMFSWGPSTIVKSLLQSNSLAERKIMPFKLLIQNKTKLVHWRRRSVTLCTPCSVLGVVTCKVEDGNWNSGRPLAQPGSGFSRDGDVGAKAGVKNWSLIHSETEVIY